jgi:hypothetical protein
MKGSKRVDHWTSGTVYECSEIVGSPQYVYFHALKVIFTMYSCPIGNDSKAIVFQYAFPWPFSCTPYLPEGIKTWVNFNITLLPVCNVLFLPPVWAE